MLAFLEKGPFLFLAINGQAFVLNTLISFHFVNLIVVSQRFWEALCCIQESEITI
jgi:hypothetical protein